MYNYLNPVIQEDLKDLFSRKINWEDLRGKTILVTGSTGMLSSYCAYMLMYLNREHDFGITLLLLARNELKLKRFFGKDDKNLHYIVQDVCDPMKINCAADYIIHAAGAASPYFIVNDPVGIIKANTLGTLNVLEYAKKSKTQKVVFTSTREVYGKIEDKFLVDETNSGVTDPLDPRSAYPESKRMAETLLKAYSLQHNVAFNALRIAHTYGPGMQIENDGRVMSDFIGDAVNSRDIVLNSTGEVDRAFCYITDAIDAMFRVLIDGSGNEAFNIANETEPIKIIDLANQIQKIAQNGKKVSINVLNTNQAGYCNYQRVTLDTKKLKKLGWIPHVSLEEGLYKTLESFKFNI